MQRVRGLAAGGRALLVFVLGCGLLLTGCRADTKVAAYVGDEQLTEADVDRMISGVTTAVEELKKSNPATPPDPASLQIPGRGDIVLIYVVDRLCAQRQDREKFPTGQLTDEQRQQLVPLPTEYYQLRLHAFSCMRGIPPSQSQPTEADLRELYDRAAAKGLLNTSYEEIKGRLAADPDIRAAIASKHDLAEMSAAGRLSVNPRYRPLEYLVNDFQTGVRLVVVILGEPGSGGAVRDVE